MELLLITRQIHCKAVEQRATLMHLIHGQYNRDWGTSYSRPLIDPYLTYPPRYRILAVPLGTTVKFVIIVLMIYSGEWRRQSDYAISVMPV